MKHVCIFIIRLYQKYLSPLKPYPTCRFTPTCSAYAIDAFRKRGFFCGLLLTIYRIMRCNPFNPGGYDPVPEKGEKWNPLKRVYPEETQMGECDEYGQEDCEDPAEPD